MPPVPPVPPEVDAFMAELKVATEGLLYPSETDAEIVPVAVVPPYPWDIEGPVESVDVGAFFRQLRGHPDAASFHALYGLMSGNLTDLRVDRVGEIRVAVFVTGVWRGGEFDGRIGVRTESVET